MTALAQNGDGLKGLPAADLVIAVVQRRACPRSGPAAGDAGVSRCACSSSGDFDRRCPTVVVASPPTI